MTGTVTALNMGGGTIAQSLLFLLPKIAHGREFARGHNGMVHA